jgi:predicted phosphoribosyltransferase
MSKAKLFRNRTHAGRQLAQALPPELHDSGAIVLALPRGGVPVGFAVARELGLELDILMVRKLGLPGHEEFAMGALGSGGVRVLQAGVLQACGVSQAALDEVCARERAEIARRERQFRGARPPPQLHGRTVILVDDGLATGSTMRAAIEVARASEPGRIVVAVPVGAPDTCAALASEVDQLVCLLRPPAFSAVSNWYQHFEQTGDDEVQDLLAMAWRARGPRAARVPDNTNSARRTQHETSD